MVREVKANWSLAKLTHSNYSSTVVIGIVLVFSYNTLAAVWAVFTGQLQAVSISECNSLLCFEMTMVIAIDMY